MGENKATLKVTLREAFRWWLEFTRPFNKLTNQEIELMSVLLYHRHLISQDVNNEVYINKILFGTEMRKQLREELGYKPQILINLLANLRKKEIIINNSIKKTFIPKIDKDYKNTTFKIIFDLVILDRDGKG